MTEPPGPLALPPVRTQDVDVLRESPSLEPVVRKSDSAVRARLLLRFVPGTEMEKHPTPTTRRLPQPHRSAGPRSGCSRGDRPGLTGRAAFPAVQAEPLASGFPDSQGGEESETENMHPTPALHHCTSIVQTEASKFQPQAAPRPGLQGFQGPPM